MSQKQTISQKRYSLKTVGKPVSSFHLEAHTPLQKKAKTVSQEMMEEFLNRQKEYDNIYKTNHRINEPKTTTPTTDSDKFHHFKDAVKQAKLRFLQTHPNSMNLKANNQKIQNYEHLTETVRMKQSCKNLKYMNSDNSKKQIDIGLVVIIAIPIICALTLLFELLK